jgi:hypothetical protein
LRTRVRPTYRRLGRRFRALPDFVIIGAQKAGTTALLRYLQAHPDVITEAGVNEVHFFDVQWDKGTPFYRSHFPYRRTLAGHRTISAGATLTGEKTPSYLFHPLAPERAATVVPRARLIALLREPVSRAASHHAMNRRDGLETLDLTEAVKAEEDRTATSFERLSRGIEPPRNPARAFSYVRRGLYAEQLERWLRFFPREQLLVLRSEDLAGEPQTTYAAVLEFLGLGPHDPVFARHNSGGRGRSSPSPEACRLLDAAFAEPNQRLAEAFGITW